MRGGMKRNDHLRHIGSDSNVTDINTEEALIRYLLDDLSRAEREAIEQRLAADPVYFEALAALEDDLILRWHRGELPDRQQRWFALAYFSSPSRQARVAAGRRLIEDIQRWKASAAAGSSPWNRVWWFWRSGLCDRVRFAGVAAVAVLVAAASSAVYITTDAARRLPLGGPDDAGAPRQVESARRLAVAVTLAPVGDRGAADGSNLVVIPPDADEIWLQFEVADLTATTGLDAMIEPLAGAIAAPVRPVRVARTSTAAQVTLTVASGDLPDGDYLLRLRQAAARDEHTIITTRTFRVIHN